MNIRPDPERLDILRAINLREKAALGATENQVSGHMSRLTEIRKETLSLQRQIDRTGGDNLTKRLEALKAEKAALEPKVSFCEQSVEIARERYQATLILQKRCAEYLAIGEAA